MAAIAVNGGAWANLGTGSIALQYLGNDTILVAVAAAAPAIPPAPGVGFKVTWREASTPQEVGDSAGVNSVWATPMDQKITSGIFVTVG